MHKSNPDAVRRKATVAVFKANRITKLEVAFDVVFDWDQIWMEIAEKLAANRTGKCRMMGGLIAAKRTSIKEVT
jgi:hypothetical protein